MSVTGPNTSFRATGTEYSQDLGARYVSKDYLIDVYPNLIPDRKVPGLWVWGRNTNGQLGLGDTTHRSSPVQVGTLTDWKYVSPSETNTLSIKTDGTLWAWGGNGSGRLGLGDLTHRSSPVQVGALTDWKQVSNSGASSFAVKTDGTLWAWGYNFYGDLGLGDTTHRSSPVQVGALTDWRQISSSGNACFAIKSDGSLWAWGGNFDGHLGLGDLTSRSSPVQVGALTDWKQIFAAFRHCLAIKTDGTLWAWGSNDNGELGLGNLTHRSSPVQVGALTDWYRLSNNGSLCISSAAIKINGTLWAWGYNGNGLLGLGDITNRSSPVQVGSLTNWKTTDLSNNHGVALKTDGTIWALGGTNSNGELGLGDTTPRSSPVQVGSLTNWRQLTLGDRHCAAISDGYIN